MPFNRVRARRSMVYALVLLLGLSAQALAADLGGSTKDTVPDPWVRESEQRWTFSFTTYAWLPWISGDATVRGRSVAVDLTPSDVLGALDWSTLPAWFSYAEARYGRLGLFNDIAYAKLTGSSGFSRSGPGGIATLNGNVRADYTQTTIEFGTAYEVWAAAPYGAASSTAFDVLAGVRYWNQKLSVSANVDVNVALPGLPISGGRAFARSGSVDWLDPFIGLRMRHALGPGQKLTVRGDIGGFGIGSDLTWQALATYEFQIRTNLDAYVGYRALSVDYSQGAGANSYRYDTIQHGPVVGLTARF